MMTKIFLRTFLPFLTVMALVAGGAWYQTISIVPFWQKDISMFKNYGHWGIDYFPILSPLMTVLWLVLVIMVSTFSYFAPFLLTYMGHPQNNLSDQELSSMLNTWARWDFVRQVIGVITLTIFIYTYRKAAVATAAK